MQVTFDSQPPPGQPTNEDVVMAGPHFAFVLDGATAAPGVDSGCIHDVAWYVNRLGGELASLLANDEAAPLPDTLAAAITLVRKHHHITCDLDNPASPSSTVSVVRQARDTVEYLVLADSPVVIRTRDGSVSTVHDDRADRLPARDPDTVNAHRNVEGGFWVAGARPDAAHQAVTGFLPADTVASVGLFSDGAARLAQRHGMSWAGLLDLLESSGPSTVIARVREADGAVEPGTHTGKTHDDATAALCRFGTQVD